MALSGIQIFKMTPKKNCKECGCPTCMAFSMKVAQGAMDISACPYMSDDAMAQLSEATAPPMKTIKVGTGDSEYTLGGETVLYRHEKTFVSKTRYAVSLCSCMSDEEIDAKLQDILDFADIGDFIHQPVKTYSSGMFVRLAFAVAINIEPEILIVDEALSVGDVFFQAKCYRKFEEFKEMGKTILFVSHDLSSIGKYCDRVVLLNKGEKLAEGDAKEMVNLYRRVLVNQYDEPGEQNTMQEETPEVQEEKSTKDQLNLNPKVLEYGSKLAEIQDFAIRDKSGMVTNVIEKGEEFSVDMKIHFHETIQEPIFAFTIKDLKGTEITGTNTMYENTPVGTQKAGETRRITFTQKMPLEAGEYMLCLGCTGYRDGDFTVFHRLYDVCNLTVITDKKAVGYFDLFSKVTLK